VYFGDKTENPAELKRIFALMESFFHGSSSGFDPLVCYLEQAVRMRGERLEILEQPPLVPGLFLLDTSIPRSTGPLVDIFMEKCQTPSYERMCQEELAPLADKAIDDYLQGDAVSLFHRVHDISRLQYLHFQEMIPLTYQGIWRAALMSPHTKIKLCGAGGGGFLLGLSKDPDASQILIGQSLVFFDETKDT
jgi:mevalonate kinase